MSMLGIPSISAPSLPSFNTNITGTVTTHLPSVPSVSAPKLSLPSAPSFSLPSTPTIPTSGMFSSSLFPVSSSLPVRPLGLEGIVSGLKKPTFTNTTISSLGGIIKTPTLPGVTGLTSGLPSVASLTTSLPSITSITPALPSVASLAPSLPSVSSLAPAIPGVSSLTSALPSVSGVGGLAVGAAALTGGVGALKTLATSTVTNKITSVATTAISKTNISGSGQR